MYYIVGLQYYFYIPGILCITLPLSLYNLLYKKKIKCNAHGKARYLYTLFLRLYMFSTDVCTQERYIVYVHTDP